MQAYTLTHASITIQLGFACHKNLSWPVLICLPAILVSRDNFVAMFLRCQYTKFDVRIGLPVRKILGIYCVSISRRDDLDILTSK